MSKSNVEPVAFQFDLLEEKNQQYYHQRRKNTKTETTIAAKQNYKIASK